MKAISGKFFKIIAFLLCFLLCFEQSGFAQVAGQLDISGHLAGLRNAFAPDVFRPLHLRYLSYNPLENNFQLFLDKGSLKNPTSQELEDTTKILLNYFFIGVTLPNDTFWVNLRPDAEDNIIDDRLAQTDVGKIMLESDLQLKKDTAQFTSPETPQGREYWDKLYRKAEELFGYENITIPTLTRPLIVPDEIIIRETTDSAYIYKATLKVMLEQDYLKDSAVYNFEDERLKQLNEYSSQLIRELIIPRLTKEINASKRYASLRQVYYSLILAQWFKARFASKDTAYSRLINRKDLTDLVSKESWSKTAYFEQYQKSFKDGEYNIQEPVYTPYGQTIRSYFSGGMQLALKPEDFAPFGGQPKLGSSPVLTLPANSSSPVGSAKRRDLVAVSLAAGAQGSLPMEQSASSAVDEGKQSASSEMIQEQQEIEEINHDFSRFSDYLKRKDFSLYAYNKTRLWYFLRARGIDAFMEVIKYNYDKYPEEIMQRFISGLMNEVLSKQYRDLEGHWHGLTKDMLYPYLDFITDIALKPAKRALDYTIDLALTRSVSGKVIMYQNKRLGAVYPIMEKDMQELLREKGFGVSEVDLDNIENKTNVEVVKYINTIMQKSEFSKSRIILVRFKIPSTISYTGLESQKEKLNTLNILSNLSRAPIVMVDGSAHNQISTAQQAVREFDQGQKINMFNADISYPYQYFNFDAPDNIDMLLPAISSDDKNGELYDEFVKRMTSRLAKDGDFWKQIEDRRMRVAKKEGGSSPLTTKEEYASSTINPKAPGGIDFRSLPIVTQAVTNLSANISSSAIHNLVSVNLDEEWLQIEKMASSGIAPSPERIKEYIQTSCAKDNITQDKDKILLCISDILRLQEERCDHTDATLIDILVVLESMSNAQELREVFLGKTT